MPIIVIFIFFAIMDVLLGYLLFSANILDSELEFIRSVC